MKSLILYYSYRGNTQRIAERVHTTIGGDIARIDTVVPYTGSYDDVVAQGEQEAHDLSGKTVYPFATNGGWLGRTLKDIAALCPGADVKPGLDVHFDDTTLRTPDKTIDHWIAAIHD